jgi:hypothetical protein
VSPEEQQSQGLPQKRESAAAARASRRHQLRQAQEFCASISFEDAVVRKRYKLGMRVGSLHPSVERSVLEIAYGKTSEIDERLKDALGAGAGLFTLLLRKSLTTDPLAEARPVGAGSTAGVEPVLEVPALEARPSIVPPSRPSKKVRGTGPPLKPGEEAMS